MGRKLKEISQFDRGMYGKADGEDISDDLAALALNTDPDAPVGVIRGIKGSSTTAELSGVGYFSRMKILQEHDGKTNLIGVGFGDDKVTIVEDYGGSAVVNSLGTVAHNNKAAIQTINNQAYIGLGSGVGSVPKWIGKIKHDRFGEPQDTGYQMEDAAAKAPELIKIPVSNVIVKSSGILTSSIVTDGNLDDLPDRGVLLIPVNGEVYLVIYNGKSGTSFTGIEWADTDDFYAITSKDLSNINNGDTISSTIYLEGGDSPGVYFSPLTLAGVDIFDNTKLRYYDPGFYTPGGDSFLPGSSYAMFYSFVYDGYKESPLAIVPLSLIRNEEDIGYGGLSTLAFIQGFYKGATNLDKRITSVKVYLAPVIVSVGEGDVQKIEVESSPHLVREINITTSPPASSPLVDSTSEEDVIGCHFSIWSEGLTGSTYEDQSGLSAGIKSATLHYGMSVQLNSYLFVADVYNPSAGGEDWSNYIVRSNPFAYESFDWANDYLVLPNPLTAIAAYAGRIYAFDEFNMYRINPQGLYVEDTYAGLGALNEESVYVTEAGMCIASRQGVYLYRDNRIEHISKPIDTIDAVDGYEHYGYRSFVPGQLASTAGENVWVRYDGEINSFVIYARSLATSTRIMWIYNLERNSWTIADGESASSACVSEKNSILISSNPGKIKSLFRGDREMWTWITKRMHMGAPSQIKKFRKIEVKEPLVNSSKVNVSYLIDSHSGVFISINNLDSGSVSSNGNFIQCKVQATDPDAEISSLSVLYRSREFPA